VGGGDLAFGLDPVDGWQGMTYSLTSLAFQLGLVALVSVQLRTAATGTGRLARGFLHAEHVLLGLAIVSTLLWTFAPGQRETAVFLALDAFWPLSMLGMFAIGSGSPSPAAGTDRPASGRSARRAGPRSPSPWPPS
jgi:hypothetical protein